MAGEAPTLTNFGGNLQICPKQIATPRSEAQLLALLAECRGRQIRAVGRLHSWSRAPATDDVLVDLRYFDQVSVDTTADGPVASVGGGCQIKRVLAELAKQGAFTLPSLGLITEQTIAGAISTGTHGSGKHCLSNYVVEVRLATYDSHTGEPTIRTISSGPELQAAKCAIGCLGIIVSVKIACRPAYHIEEHVRFYQTLGEVLAAERNFPLQQFFLLPWSWQFIGQHRREVDQPRSRLAGLYRAYWFATIDISLHLIIKFLVQGLHARRSVKFFYRRLLSLFVIRNWHVVDDSSRMLVMEHELFRHIEIELFVRQSQLPAAVAYVREIVECFAGKRAAISLETQQNLRRLGLLDQLYQAAGSYTHHYVICIRRVLADDTQMAMSSGGDESWYALSFISYARPQSREGFFKFADFLATSMAALFAARPHWGKFCPLDGEQIQRLYPNLDAFRNICRQIDPDGAFCNSWLKQQFRL